MPDPTALPFTLRLFGPFEATVHGTPLPRLRSRKGQWLLALLALRDGAPVERSWLAGTLWPDSDTPQSAASLRGTLADLRRALGPEADRLQSPTSRTLALDLDGAFVDALAFDRGADRQDGAGLEEAVACYRGPLLEGCEEEWVFEERQAYEQTYLTALERLAARAEERQAWAEAAGFLRRVVAVEGTRESAQRGLMRALAAGGNTAAAMEVYRDLRDLLHRELNAEPDPETRALHQRIRSEARERASRTAPGDSRLSHRLPASLSPPQPSGAGPLDRPGDPEELLAPDGWPPGLPRPLTRFIGREAEIAAVKRRLSERCLVTLAGPGGCGKTRLALQVAADLAEEFSGDVRFVELAPLADPGLVPTAFAAAVNVREVPGQPLIDTLTLSLRARHLLVVLDNCEHLIEASARLAERLLQGCPHLRILATSREALAIPGETMLPIPPLTLPEPGENLAPEELTRFAAVSLFIDRASAAISSFTVTALNGPVLVRICRQLDGIPLAIELAAARIRVLPLEQLAPRLEKDFRLLSGGSRTALPRQQTLRATIDWSYDLISEPERRLLRRLSVFRGGWSLEAAEAICADDETEIGEVLDLLGQLVEKSLVVYEERIDGARYRLLETIRQYGYERLAEGDEQAGVRDRHGEYFLHFVETAAVELKGPRLGEWLRRLEREHDNVRAALDHCEETEEGVDAGLRMAAALQRFWAFRGYHHEARDRLGRVIARADGKVRTPALARALMAATMTARDAGAYGEARRMYEEALALGRESEDCWCVASALGGLAMLARNDGDWERARKLCEESLTIHRAQCHVYGEADALFGLGSIAEARGDRQAARAIYEESLAAHRRVGCPNPIVELLCRLAGLDSAEGNHARAVSMLEEALRTSREIGLKWAIVFALHQLSRVAVEQEEYAQAREYCEEAIAVARQLAPFSLVTALHVMGDLLLRLNEVSLARPYLEEAAELVKQMDDRALAQESSLLHRRLLDMQGEVAPEV